mmetsp:Transcript_53741/g.136366  ORF Transcript_53741/g.136366 Transcript_53741/m.136366 type:complete len:206 (+) Transcript_53741:65-682(+)
MAPPRHRLALAVAFCLPAACSAYLTPSRTAQVPQQTTSSSIAEVGQFASVSSAATPADENADVWGLAAAGAVIGAAFGWGRTRAGAEGASLPGLSRRQASAAGAASALLALSVFGRAAPAEAAPIEPGTKVDINNATPKDYKKLPGMYPNGASYIVRDAGSYKSVKDIYKADLPEEIVDLFKRYEKYFECQEFEEINTKIGYKSN